MSLSFAAGRPALAAPGTLFAILAAAGATGMLFGAMSLLQYRVAAAPPPAFAVRELNVNLSRTDEPHRPPPAGNRARRSKPLAGNVPAPREKLSVSRAARPEAAPRPSLAPMQRFLVNVDVRPLAPGALPDLHQVAIVVPPPNALFDGTGSWSGDASGTGWGPSRGGRAGTLAGGAGAAGRGDGKAEAPNGPRDASEVDRKPARTFYVDPIYPEAARRLGVEGWVDVEFTVGTDGRVSDAKVAGSTGGGRFDGAALAAVRRWMFRPGAHRGEDVPVLCRVRITFRLVD